MARYRLAMMDVQRVLLVGLGNISVGYDLTRDDVTWTHVSAISKHENFNIIAAVDPSDDALVRFSRVSSANVFNNLDDFLESDHGKVDLVVIASPTINHLEHFIKIKVLEPKLVLMEKPLVAAGQSLKEFMIEAKQGPKVMVNLFRLYQNKINLKLAELANSGPCRIQVRYSQELHHNAIHFISLIMSHFGVLDKNRKINIQSGKDIHLIFEKAEVWLQPAMGDLDDNSMIVYSNEGTLYYLNGGRFFFFVDTQHHQHHFSHDEFQHHMLNVYQQCLGVINGKEDHSLELAYKGHKLLVECEQHVR